MTYIYPLNLFPIAYTKQKCRKEKNGMDDTIKTDTMKNEDAIKL